MQSLWFCLRHSLQITVFRSYLDDARMEQFTQALLQVMGGCREVMLLEDDGCGDFGCGLV